ncbi:uncharacterized protein LOC129871105 isoform X2 [Solanum dulcamara]|nr:uncharacterized protein LOC129871105 isoform X2 [Solanum dulcamara]XP_055801953.1 uncharacterized protein LOC129871105 isoform X2 [Solanum dulcamara]XP_055801954.1 uncharacterized protein LOC129871105 isoform X2 [Solanum dulcamara]
MLGKLQEASEYMKKLRKRESGATGVGRTISERVVADHWYDNKVEFGKRSLSVDRSRDCYDELREVIRDSLARQNLLPPCCASEKARFDRRKVDLYQDFSPTSFTSSSESLIEKACVADARKLVMSPELPSTSSSQFASFDCSRDKEKPKVPNLIARLMGLEEVPSTPLHQKQLEKDKILKPRRPIFEIDLPKATKQSVINQKVDPKRRTLDGIIETMQFKGLLRCKSNNVISHQLKSSADDAPPIVIMKPVYAPELQAERFSTSSHDENPPDTKDSFGKRNLKEENSPANFTIYRKMQTRKVQKSSCIPEKGSKDHSEGTLPLTKNRASSPGRTKQPKKEVFERTQRAPGAKKSGEMKNAGPSNTTKVQDQSKRTTAKVMKLEKKSNAPEKLVAFQNSADSKRITAVAAHNSRNRKKNVKTDKSVKSSSIVPIVENMEHNDERDSDIAIKKVTSSEELPCEKVAEISQNVVSDNLKNGECSAAESTVPLFQCDDDVPLMEHTRYQIHLASTEKENLKSGAITRHILLSNESFLSRAEELFDTDAWEPTVWKTISVDNEMPNSTLVLDCANELLENIRSQRTLEISKSPVNMSRVSISFDKLLNEICDAIEVLKSYTKVDANSLSVDTLYALHKRDLSCNRLVSTAWDLGWRNAFTLDEVKHVVTDIEKHVLNGIIEDVLTEFTL